MLWTQYLRVQKDGCNIAYRCWLLRIKKSTQLKNFKALEAAIRFTDYYFHSVPVPFMVHSRFKTLHVVIKGLRESLNLYHQLLIPTVNEKSDYVTLLKSKNKTGKNWQ